ncbi:MAG: ABC transporter ATP-binding protein [Oscillospiraceae bacterium]
MAVSNSRPGPGGPGGPGGRGGRKAKNAKGTLKRLLALLWKGNRLRLITVMVCIVISAGASAAGSIFLRTLIDDYVDPMLASGSRDFSGLFSAIMVMIAIYAAGIISTFLYNRLMISVAQGTLRDIRNQMFGHMQELPIKYFDTHTHGDIMSKYTNDTDTLRQLISQSIPQLLNTCMTIIVVFISMCVMSIWLTLIVVVFLIIKFAFVGRIGGKSGSYFVKQQQSLGRVNGFAEEMINGQKVIKVFNHEDKARQQFDTLNEELCENATKANIYANILMPIMANLGHLLYVVCAIAGGAMAIGGVGNLTLGSIVSFLQLTRNFNMPINQASQQINSVVMALAGAERVFELMDEPAEEDHGEVTLVNVTYNENGTPEETDSHSGQWAWRKAKPGQPVQYIPVRGDVRFNGVDFSYEEGHPVLYDISLYAKPGQKLAFVGATGAGKTTITNLINRFYDIEDGKITYDGININRICKSDLRRSLGIVLQDVNLFTGTVMDNIRYGKLDATDEECIEAAKRANAHDFISRLPQGYYTQLSGDGSGLSQGQCQLLSIARAAVADPPVMILDEATSSIDTRTERIVQQGMDSLMEGRTVFVIAHRLSTVMNSNAIIVLEHGHIIERGTHDQLIAEKGTYYQLYTGAFELE